MCCVQMSILILLLPSVDKCLRFKDIKTFPLLLWSDKVNWCTHVHICMFDVMSKIQSYFPLNRSNCYKSPCIPKFSKLPPSWTGGVHSPCRHSGPPIMPCCCCCCWGGGGGGGCGWTVSSPSREEEEDEEDMEEDEEEQGGGEVGGHWELWLGTADWELWVGERKI